MVEKRDMPPDPFAEDGVDAMPLEHAEDLARRGVDPAHPAWDRFDGPDLDDFDRAAEEIRCLEEPCETDDGSEMRYALVKTAVAAVSVVVVVALLVLYVW